jgi:hypothetical protein
MHSPRTMLAAAFTLSIVLATAGCADEALPTAARADVRRMGVTASSTLPAVVQVGDTVALSSALRGPVRWTIRDPSVARFATNSSVVALAEGVTYIVAEGAKRNTAGERDSTLLTVAAPTAVPPADDIPVPPLDTAPAGPATDTISAPAPIGSPEPTVRAGYYVSPTGSSSAGGSHEAPWDLATALRGGNGRVQPGDTIWVRGGTYHSAFRSELNGTAARPVVVRRYPGERATIDGALVVYGSHTAVWGLEVMNSDPVGTSLQGVNVRAPGTKLINLVVHDAGQTGIGFWVEAPDAEIHGSIVYNNGTHENLDHGIYAMNRDGIKHITDNVVFNNLAYGIHVYGQNGQYIRNFVIDGNASFNNASISSTSTGKPNLFVGGASIAASGITITDNTLYFSTAGGTNGNLRLGYDDTQNGDVVVRNNYVVGGSLALEMRRWSTVTMSGNAFHGSARMMDLFSAGPTGQSWSGNVYRRDPRATAWRFNGTSYTFEDWRARTGLGSADDAVAAAPSGTRVVVRRNRYEAGRAHVIVNNWAMQGAVAADLTGVLNVGDRYEVHSVQDLYGVPVASGTYGGGSITVPMTGVRPPTPIGRATAAPAVTGPRFDVFVVTRVAGR